MERCNDFFAANREFFQKVKEFKGKMREMGYKRQGILRRYYNINIIGLVLLQIVCNGLQMEDLFCG